MIYSWVQELADLELDGKQRQAEPVEPVEPPGVTEADEEPSFNYTEIQRVSKAQKRRVCFDTAFRNR